MAEVRLVAYSDKPLSLSVASARTCYSPRIVLPEELKQDTKQRIGKGIYESGHHTPFQHASFTFALSGVSRQFVWSFLHTHPYYNSEQTSQRYNVLGKQSFYIPPTLDDKQKMIFSKAIETAWESYSAITEVLKKEKLNLASTLGRIKGWKEKAIASDLEKKAIENSRYVLPICAHTNLYHTVSALVLQRYAKMVNATECTEEAMEVVGKMIEEVRKIDPEFHATVQQKEFKTDEIPENRFSVQTDYQLFAKEFDSSLGNRKFSKLVRSTEKAQELIAECVEQCIGKKVGEDEALELVLSPAKNPYLLSTLNVSFHSPLMQCLHHISYTFRKKISHCCDSQDQRHRGTPGSRPLLHLMHSEKPDYVVPEVVEQSESIGEFRNAMEKLWEAKAELENEGVDKKLACYLLPNAVPVRFTESAPLIHLIHKLRMRTCFNAQHEIFQASVEELEQIDSVHPGIARFIGPPCFMGKGIVKEDPLIGPCTEGVRWCGIKTWLGWPKIKRPF